MTCNCPAGKVSIYCPVHATQIGCHVGATFTTETEPLVAGGQGRSGADLVESSFLYILFMLCGAGFVTLSIGPWWLSVGVGMLVIVVAIVGAAASTPVTTEERPRPPHPIDVRG